MPDTPPHQRNPFAVNVIAAEILPASIDPRPMNWSIRRKTRKRYSSEYKIRIVLAGLRGEDTIAELCRQEGIAVTR